MQRVSESPPAGAAFRVGEWRVEPASNEVERDGDSTHLEPRVMDLLVYLAKRAGEVVTKEDLTRDVWKGQFVGDDAFVSAVSALRRALRDDPRRPKLVQTIPKRGYRLIAPVEATQVSVVVLPLENLSGDSGEDFFADGMTDALIAALGSHPRGLRVISRTTSRRLGRSELTLAAITQTLGVDVVLEGSVLRQSELVRITVQLIDARKDEHLWGETYERKIGEVLALQTELARDVDRRVRSVLSPSEPSETEAETAPQVDPQSFVEYLRGRFEMSRFTQDLFAGALAHFDKARALDPASPFPYLGIADVWGWRTVWGLVPTSVSRPEMANAASRLSELGESLAQAHTMLAKYAYNFEWDWMTAEEEFKRALELNPNDATTLWSRGLFLLCRKRVDEALSVIRRAVDLDPLDANPRAVLGLAWMFAGRAREGLMQVRRGCELDPVPPPRLTLWLALEAVGEYEEALAAAADFYTMLGKPEVVSVLAEHGGDEARGYRVAMREAAAALIAQRRDRFVQPTQIARLLLHGNSHSRALQWLETAYEERDSFLIHIGWPEWEPLHSYSAYRSLLKRIGLPL